MSWISYQEKTGTPIQAGNAKLTLTSKSFVIHPPGGNGGILWNRPVRVRVESETGEVQVLPIQDVTRQAVLLFFIVGLTFGFLIRMIGRN
jgi:hypothetical protein